MIINSKFKDYYDTAIQYGVDKTIIYNRNYSIIRFEDMLYQEKQQFNKLVKDLLLYPIPFKNQRYPIVLSFCNKKYYFWTDCSCSFDPFDSYEEIIFEPELLNKCKTEPIKKYAYFYKFNTVEDLIQQQKEQSIDLLFLHRKYNAPILLISESNIYINPILRHLNFNKIINSTEAFQQIASFISGILGTKEKEIINISDVDMAAKKGFNKYSFRKEKQKQ